MGKIEIDKAKAMLKTVSSKLKASLCEVRDNFNADDGATGFQGVKSKFVNLWKSGTPGRVAIIICFLVLLQLLCAICGGIGTNSDGITFARQKPEEKDFFDDLKEIHDATQELKRNWDKDVKEPFNKLVEEFDINSDQKDACNIEKEFEKAAEQLQSELKRLTRSDDEDEALDQIEMLTDFFEKRENPMTEFEETVFEGIVDKIVVINQHELEFHLIGGLKFKEKM